MTETKQFGRTTLPSEQEQAIKKAVRWEVFTIVYTSITIAVIALVVGESQAMRTAWIEDMLSLIPQIAFLTALLFVRRRPTKKHPYGLHRAMGVGHLVAGVALLAVGLNLAIEAVTGLIAGEHPTIGTVQLFGQTIWLGWLMVAVMAVVIVGPVFLYGPAKSKLAPVLHNKLLYADADMAKADWQTTVASIVGVLGVGVGVWWLDGAAALFISLGIIWDGFRNTRTAIVDLMDQRARTYDSKNPHPLARDIVSYLRSRPWVADAGVRMRDQGQVFHVEAFVVPHRSKVSVEDIDAAAAGIADIDWKMQDVVVMPVGDLPDEADTGR
ncbi:MULTISPECIES: cation transporter [Microbacterium]|uniref:Cation transporter n=1 Tax=Microbacterium algeriense TaxID=2615184 RepID=A0ABQ6V2Y1_9MICO|nr:MULTISPECIES: cation transporter [Microbacterium]AZH77477.1 cation transporter [Microbacterium sp. Y-01]KAB1862493.1 cation transporter [Microbacterium algeriense]MDX2399334.1 cation transporter [Microbacterium algeriense]